MIAANAKAYSEQTFTALLKANKLVLIDFSANWCAPCKAMRPVVDQVSNEFKGKALVEKLDIEANSTLAKAFQVQSIPGFLIFKDGKKVWTHTGPISYAELSGVLKKYL